MKNRTIKTIIILGVLLIPASVMAMNTKNKEDYTKKMFSALKEEKFDDENMKKAIDEAIEAGVDINAKDKEDHGRTLLHKAAYKGLDKIFGHLILKNADTTIKDENGWTALHFITGRCNDKSQQNRLDMISGISDSVDVNAKTEYGETALSLAILKQCSDIAAFLIKEKRADINAADPDPCYGNTILHNAVKNNDEKIVEMLLLEGRGRAGAKAKNNAGETPLDIAKKNKNEEIINLLSDSF